MSNVVSIWQPSHEREGRKNLLEFVRFAKNELTLYSDQEDDFGKGWDAVKWRTRHARPVAMVFGFGSSYYTVDEPFEQPFMDFAKAFVRQEQSIDEKVSVSSWIYVLRLVYRSLQAQYPGKNTDILDFNADTQVSVEHAIRTASVADKKKYHYGGKFAKFNQWLFDKKIILTLPEWQNPFKRGVDKIEQLDESSKKWRDERCPSQHVMFTLADCFAKAETVKDRYYTSIMVLLCFAPGRASEIASLTVNSLQEEEGRFYVSWFSEKGFGDTKKWVPTAMVDVVKEAFNRLIEIGEPARKAAKHAYDYPDKFMIHSECTTPKDYPQNKPLGAIDFANASGIQSPSPRNKNVTTKVFRQQWVKQLLEKGEPTYHDLNKLVHKKYKKKDWPDNPMSGRPVWENLCLIREYEAHASAPTKLYSWVMPSVNEINSQIKKRTEAVSTLWERFGVKDEDGSEISLTSHQLRVWLNTHAHDGGMSDYLLAQWSGRADIEQNKAYDARTEGEKARLKNEIMNADQSNGPSALTIHRSKSPVPLSKFGINRTGVADFTGLGFCVHNFAQSPCTKAGECVTCKDHVCMKGLPDTLENLEELEKLVAEQLDVAKAAADDHTFGADRWVTHLGWKLAHLRTIIAGMKDESVKDGTLIRIPVEHDPSPTRRALEAKGETTELQEEDEKASLDLKKQMLGIF